MSHITNKENLTQVEEAYCHYFSKEVRNHIVEVAYTHPNDTELTRNLILKAIEPAADTRKKKYFVAKIKSMNKPMNMALYVFNSFLKALDTPAYDYSYLHK